MTPRILSRWTTSGSPGGRLRGGPNEPRSSRRRSAAFRFAWLVTCPPIRRNVAFSPACWVEAFVAHRSHFAPFTALGRHSLSPWRHNRSFRVSSEIRCSSIGCDAASRLPSSAGQIFGASVLDDTLDGRANPAMFQRVVWVDWKGQTDREVGTQSHRSSWRRQRGCQSNGATAPVVSLGPRSARRLSVTLAPAIPENGLSVLACRWPKRRNGPCTTHQIRWSVSPSWVESRWCWRHLPRWRRRSPGKELGSS